MDDDDKIRRNLVMFSALVLVTTGLGLPVNQVLAKVTGADAGSVDARSIWLVALATHAYLWLRYRKTPPTPVATPQVPIPKWWDEVIAARRAACAGLGRLTQNWPMPYLRLGVFRTSPLAKARDMVESQSALFTTATYPREFSRVESLGFLSYKEEDWDGEARFGAVFVTKQVPEPATLEQRIAARNAIGTEPFEIPYRVPLLHRLWIIPFSYLKATFYSPATAVTRMPYCLALFAFGCIAYNLYNPQWTTKLPPEPPSLYKQVILPA